MDARPQWQVFSNCDGGLPSIPPPAAAELPEIIRKDCAYQIAAAHLYARQYDKARSGFEAIAEETAQKILADPRLAATHGMTFALLRRMRVKQNDAEYFHRLSTLLASPGQGNGLSEELWEFTRTYDNLSGYDPWGPPAQLNLTSILADDLPDWIASFQDRREDSNRQPIRPPISPPCSTGIG